MPVRAAAPRPARIGRRADLAALVVLLCLGCGGGGDGGSPTTAPTPPTPPAPPAPPPPAATVQSIVVTPTTATLDALGATTALTAEVRLSNGATSTQAVTWSSSNTAVATASGPAVTAVGNGTSTITAAIGEVRGTATVTVRQAIASVRLAPADTVVRTGFTLRGAVLDPRGNAVADTAPQWTALTPAVSTVDQRGATSPQATGVARFRLAAGTQGATATVRTIWNVRQLRDLFPLYEFTATSPASGQRRVFSDVSQAHADARLAHVNAVWNALAPLWPSNGAPNTDLYFTASRAIWAEAIPFCGGQDLPGQTAWTQCTQSGRQHFLVPEGEGAANDYFNIARFLTRQFVAASHAASPQFPWLLEGYPAIVAGGRIEGTTIVPGVARVTRADFRRGDSAAVLAPLDSLLRLPSADFYRDLAIRTPVAIRVAQATMFVAYLAAEHPAALSALIARIRANPGTGVSNEDAIQLLVTQTGRTLAQLQAGTLAWARAQPPS